MRCPFKFSHYEFEGGQECIGSECGMHNLCNVENEITAAEFDALDEHAQALERENEELRKLCGANDALAVENGVSEASVDANDVNADTREELEADVCDLFWGDNLQRYARQKGYLDGSGIEVDESITTTNHEGHVTATTVMHLLDRQEAITRRECADTRVNFAERMRFGDEIDELRAKVDELTAENAKLSSELAAARNAHAQAEYDVETYREKLGRILDNAHEITRIGGDC